MRWIELRFKWRERKRNERATKGKGEWKRDGERKSKLREDTE